MIKLSSASEFGEYKYVGREGSSPFLARLHEIGLAPDMSFTLIKKTKYYSVIIIGGSIFSLSTNITDKIIVQARQQL